LANKNSNDVAWEKAVQQLGLLKTIRDAGWVDIAAKDLRSFREPRLMAKIDYSANRPIVFREEGLNILAISSTHYRVGRFNPYREVDKGAGQQVPITRVNLPLGIESLEFKGLTSESAVITSAFAAGVLEDFCGEDLILTTFGRMRTPKFDFSISGSDGAKYDLSVDSATIEIDAAYENRSGLHVFEVKNHAPRDFNMRQLYYPFRTWRSKITKPVQPIFLTYSNDIYDLYRLSFNDEHDFSSSVIEEHKRYTVAEGHIVLQDLEELSLRISLEEKWNRAYADGVPFPQADSLPRIIDLVSILLEQSMTVEGLALHYGFDPRQSDYYYNAAKYLGLAESKKDPDLGVELRQPTPMAQRIFALPYREKFLALPPSCLVLNPSIEASREMWEKA